MKKNIDYWEGESDEKEKIPLSAFELSELIEQRIESKGNKHWKKEVNSLIDEYNERFERTYKRV